LIVCFVLLAIKSLLSPPAPIDSGRLIQSGVPPALPGEAVKL
jgi:hypothetical protein